MRNNRSSSSAKQCSLYLSSHCSQRGTRLLRCYALPVAMRCSRPRQSSCTIPQCMPHIKPTTNTRRRRPALTSSALGILTIAYNFLSSRRYEWNTAAITGTVISTTSTVMYGILLLWTHRRIVKMKAATGSRTANMWSEPGFYTNFIQNMYPSASRANSAHRAEIPLSEDDRINQQMAMLLMKSDPGPSPDASSATFRIDLPDDEEERQRLANSSELVGTPPTAARDWNRSRDRANSRPDSLSEEQAWLRWDRGRTQNRPSSVGARSNHSRGLSREERRREIEMGQV